MTLVTITVAAALLFYCSAVTAQGLLRVCYYSNGAQYRPENAKMTPSQIDPNLCTHLIYAFAKLDANSEISFREWNEGDMVKEFNSLKTRNPSLKTLLAVGGYNQGSEPFSDMAADRNLRSTFIRSAVEFLRKWDFDGLDLVWEFPGGKGGRRADKRNFISLLKELKQAFDNGDFLLSIAVPAGKAQIDAGFNVAEMAQYVDFVSLMAYDFHGDWERTAGHNSPLYSREWESDADKIKNVDWAAKYWTEQGVPKEKLIVGLPTYGRHYTLSRKNQNGIGARIRGPGPKDHYTKEDGFLAYYEVCQLVGSSKRVWQTEQGVPYLIHKNYWIGYDDAESFTLKLNYIRENGYGGAMVWNIDMDDFNQRCPDSDRKFPLISLLVDILGDSSQDILEESLQDESEYYYDYYAEDENEGNSGGNEDQEGYKRVCYLESWSKWFPRSAVDASLCTHIILAFIKMKNNELVYKSTDATYFKVLRDLKYDNPNLKILIATGGWKARSKIYSNMVTDIDARKHFVLSTAELLRNMGLDGLAIDWKFPARRGGRKTDKENFIALLRELREEFDRNSPRLLLTGTVSAAPWNIKAGYNVPEMARYMDFLNLQSFDFHGHWDSTAGHNSPLFAKSSETGGYERWNLAWAAQYYLELGCPAEKLTIGLPTYGRCYKLPDSSKYNIGDPIQGSCGKGDITKQDGLLAYFEVCKRLENGATRYWDDEQRVPFLVDGDQWIGYDDIESLTEKIDYIKGNGFGGAMIWAVDLDDFDGSCQGNQQYPLMNFIKDTLKGDRLNIRKFSLEDGSNRRLCSVKGNGLHRVPDDCHAFINCSEGDGKRDSCGKILQFNQERQRCEFPKKGSCSDATASEKIQSRSDTSNFDLSALAQGLSKIDENSKHPNWDLSAMERELSELEEDLENSDWDLSAKERELTKQEEDLESLARSISDVDESNRSWVDTDSPDDPAENMNSRDIYSESSDEGEYIS